MLYINPVQNSEYILGTIHLRCRHFLWGRKVPIAIFKSLLFVITSISNLQSAISIFFLIIAVHWMLQINLFQKDLFLHQLIQIWLKIFIELQIQYLKFCKLRTCWEHVVYTNCFLFLHSEQFMHTACSQQYGKNAALCSALCNLQYLLSTYYNTYWKL